MLVRSTPRHLCQGWGRVPLNIVQVGDCLADEAQESLSDELLLLFDPFARSDKVVNYALKQVQVIVLVLEIITIDLIKTLKSD